MDNSKILHGEWDFQGEKGKIRGKKRGLSAMNYTDPDHTCRLTGKRL
jgi:hypothetical protein